MTYAQSGIDAVVDELRSHRQEITAALALGARSMRDEQERDEERFELFLDTVRQACVSAATPGEPVAAEHDPSAELLDCIRRGDTAADELGHDNLP